MNKEDTINFAVEPSLYLKIGDATFGVDKKILIKNSDEFETLLRDDDESVSTLNFTSDTNLTSDAFNVVMMFYYTPTWCKFNISNDHYSIIWQIVYCCHKFGFSKLLNEIEKYLIENCNFYFETLKIASHFKLRNLRKKCLMFLSTNFITDDKMEGIKDISQEDLISLIKFQNQYISKPKTGTNSQSK